MTRSKKRRELPQSSRILDFFSPSAKRSRYDTSQSATSHPVAELTLKDEDIIIISDDEEIIENRIDSASESTGSELSHRSVFGIPMLSESKLQPGPTSAASRSSLNEQFNVTSSIKETEALYAEWGMGDDEGFFPDADEDDNSEVDQVKIELCQKNYDEDTACPVCGKKLIGLFLSEVEKHVNVCIDSVSSKSSLQCVKRNPCPNVQAATSPVKSTSTPSMATVFSVLMSSHKENNAWKEATEAENNKSTRGRRPAPFFKIIQGMPIAVDAFRYGKIPGITAYFLTHAHSDHYTNLSASWKHGSIYCSQTTANLIIHMLNVDPRWVFPLPMDTPTVVPDTGGVEVTLISANHCPGSVLFLFKGRQTVNAGDSAYKSPFVGSHRVFRYLHCGDFRACPQQVLHSEVKGKKIDIIYLDTTYLDPKYCFPPQPLVISACAELAHRIVHPGHPLGKTNRFDETSDEDNNSLTDWVTKMDKGKGKATAQNERILVVVGTYSIGKERIVQAIATTLTTKVYCDPRKTAILKCLLDDKLHELLTDNPLEAGVHVVPLHMITSDNFKDYLSQWKGRWTKAVGFRPTGWTYTPQIGADVLPNIPYIISREQRRTFTHVNLRPMRNSTPSLMLYGVPYSEHSSFFELTCFALSLDWGKMIATVNVGNAKSRGRMEKWFEKWQTERIKRLTLSGEQDVVQYRCSDYW